MMALLETDPVVFKRDADGQLKFPLELASGLEAVSIGIRTRLLLLQGEWFLNLGAGVEYLPSVDGSNAVTEREAILGQRFDAVKTRAAIRREILTTPGVVAITTLLLSFDRNTRRLSITWIAKTRFGDTPVETLEFVA